jgi:MYXO-CTERM domain-containing protein
MPKALALLFALSVVLSAASRSQAQGLDSCGNINVEAEAQCEVVAPGVQCEAQCTPVSVEAACSARLVADCDGECNVTPPQGCSVDCSADCNAECTVNPGMFDCAARCDASCSGKCEGECSASANKADCMGACEGTCSAKCEGGCDVVPPEANCEGKCEASCDASCEVEAELDCHVECQTDAYAQCKVDVQGGCMGECQTMEGALFCDGEYVDHGDNLAECVEAIELIITAEVDGYAEGSSSCDGASCKAEGKAGVSCAATPGEKSAGAGFAGLLGATMLLASRRRNRR